MGLKSRKIRWHNLEDEELLDCRFKDLGLNIGKGKVYEGIQQLYHELRNRNIRFLPHCWFGEEWFSPDGIPGISIPFYLAHPRLKKLEARQMYDVEGRSPQQFMQLLRHEAGHAIMTAYQLSRVAECRKVFGPFSKPYPTYYTPRPQSRRYVLHLDWWYAQAHPAEDFAETFAVWLRPRSNWRSEYRGWPALKKLEYMDELMRSISRKSTLSRKRNKIEPVTNMSKTLRRHYQEKKDYYGVNIKQFYDQDLLRVFSTVPPQGKRRLAATFLRQIGPKLCIACVQSTGEHPYTISQLLKEMMQRCRELKLYIADEEEVSSMRSAVFLSFLILNYLHKIRHRVPL
jgi:hypothetical protein